MAEKTRVQFDFTPAALQELDRLQAALGVNTRAEVIRNSLRVLQWLTEQLRDEGRILVQDKNGNVQNVVFPFLRIQTNAQDANRPMRVIASY